MPVSRKMPVGTITFLFTDIEGSTRLWEKYPRAMQAAIARHDTLLREAIEQNDGYVFKTVGDAFCAAFPTAPQALDAALAAQRALHSADWEATGSIKARMALHTGVAEARDKDYFGLPLNRVARLLSTGSGEQILLSLATQQLVRDHMPPGTDLKDLGEGGLKDLVKSEHIYQVVAADLPSDFPPLKSLDTQYIEPDGRGGMAAVPVQNPYKGLRAFQETDAADFFGREELTERLLARLGEEGPLTRFLAVVGPSGSGKSSVVHAGLVPALRQGKLPGSDRWLVVEILPGAHPLEELEAVLLSIAVNPPESLINQLREDERGLVRAVKRVLPRDETIELVLVIDQFEEVFTLVEDEPTRVHFLESLHAAITDPRSRLRVVVTLRADFFDRPLLYPDPGELMRQRTAVVLPLSAEELERAVVRPAQRIGVTLEAELIAATAKDVGEQPGALPLLQYAMTELFERRVGKLMTLEAYRQSGGVLGALARRADELYDGLNEEEKEAARQLFLRLVTLGEGAEDTRRRVRLSELASIAPDDGRWTMDDGVSRELSVLHRPSFASSGPIVHGPLDRVLDTFGRYRLLTFDRDPITNGPTVEVAHEALIRTWGQLQEWLDASRADLRVQRQLMAAAGEWASAGRDRSFLAAGARLSQFEALAEGADRPGGVALTAEERAYLQASVEERGRQEVAERGRQAHELELQKRAASRLRVLVAGLAVFLLVAAILTVWALNQSQVAQTNATRADQSAATAVANQNEANSQRQLAVKSEATAQANFSRADAQRLASEASLLLGQEGRDPSLIALLTLRSLNTGYTPQGDAALVGATTLVYPSQVISTGILNALAFSQEASPWLGRYMLTSSADKVVRVWDLQTGKEAQRLVGHTGTVQGAAFSPDGKYALTASADKTARLWDPQTGQELRRFVGHTDAILSVDFSPDGKWVATASADKTARLWDAATGQELRRFTGHTASVQYVAFVGDGKRLVTRGGDASVRLWDVASGAALQQIAYQSGTPNTLLDARGQLRYLAVLHSPGSAGQFWDLTNGNMLVTMPGGLVQGYVSPDGKTLLTGTDTGLVQMWDALKGAMIHEFTGLKLAVHSLALAPDGRTVAAGDWGGNVFLWDTQSGAVPRRLAGLVGSVNEPHGRSPEGISPFSADGRRFLTSDTGNNVRLWDIQARPGLPQFVGHTGGVESAIFSPDGRSIFTGSVDRTARLWDAQTGAEVRRFLGHTAIVNWAALTPDGKRALTAGFDNTARSWDAATGQELRRFDLPGEVASVAISHDGRYGAATPSGEKTSETFVFDLQSGAQVYTLTARSGYNDGIDFSPDGNYLLVGGSDGIGRLWDLGTGKEAREFKGHTNVIYGAVFSPDGKSVLTGSYDKTVRLWDVATGQEVRRFVGHADLVLGVAFSHDGKYILSGSVDRTARLWDVATGQELRRFQGHTDAIESVAFSPDDRLVLTGSDDKTARLWYADYHDDVSYLCGKLLRDFTADERAQYEIKGNEPTCPK